MSDPNPTGQQPGHETPSSPEVARLQADLEQTRQRLAETVDALGAKLDVKTRAGEKAAQLKEERSTEIAVAGGMALALLIALVVWRRRR